MVCCLMADMLCHLHMTSKLTWEANRKSMIVYAISPFVEYFGGGTLFSSASCRDSKAGATSVSDSTHDGKSHAIWVDQHHIH